MERPLVESTLEEISLLGEASIAFPCKSIQQRRQLLAVMLHTGFGKNTRP